MSNDQKKPSIRVVADVSVIDEKTCDYSYCGKLVCSPSGVYGFVPSQSANPENLYKLIPYANNQGARWFEKNRVGPLSDLLPIKGSMVDVKLRHLLSGFGGHHDGRKLEALIKSGSVVKHGIKLDSVEPRKLRDKVVSEKLKVSAENFNELKSSFADILPMLKDGRDIEIMKGNDSYLNLIKKSMGHSNLLLKVDHDGHSKFLKMDTSLNNIDELMLEAVANKVIIASGSEAPKTDVLQIQHTNGGEVNVLLMDDFSEKVINGFPVELRKLSIATALGKTDSDIHNMTYSEISAGVEQLERFTANPSSQRIEENRQALFKWALLNSAFNNTDNHGRNLEIIIEDGHPKVAPFFDMKFSHANEDMSTYLDGDPPIHNIDVTNDREVLALHEQIGLEGDFSNSLDMRNSVVNGILSIPQFCSELGVERQEINIIAQAVSMQSQALGKGLKQVFKIEFARMKDAAKEVDVQNDASVSV